MKLGFVNVFHASLAVALVATWASSAAWAERPIKKSARVVSPPRPQLIEVAGECVDSDGDGYGEGTGCAGADCNDDNGAVHPGATESCNGADDDCDGDVDEGFILVNGQDGDPDSPTFLRFGDLALGRACVNGRGICSEFGTVVCNPAGTAATCNAVPGLPDPRGEGQDAEGKIDPTAQTCFDRLDNDCDGLTDHGGIDTTDPNNPVRANTNCTAPERCDGFDNDNNGVIDDALGLGTACTAGAGACRGQGVLVCGDDGAVVCNAQARQPQAEDLAHTLRCSDGIDNDCDGLIDIADESCQVAESCDGRDNDGDQLIDEDFPDLGNLCASGIGPCQRVGIRICAANGRETACSAVAVPGSPEGATSASCFDDIDNDCDGFTDAQDAGCADTGLSIRCALLPVGNAGDGKCPYYEDDENHDDHDNHEPCLDKYTVYFETSGADPSDAVSAEVVGFDAAGGSVTGLSVKNGDIIRLDHRTDVPASFRSDPVNTSNVFATFLDQRVGNTFRLVPRPGQTKLPSYLYFSTLLLPDVRLVEKTRIDLTCRYSLNPGTRFGPFEVVSFVSASPPRNGQTCRNGVAEITLRYVGDDRIGTPPADIVVTTSSSLPKGVHIITAPAPLLRVTAQSSNRSAHAYCGPIPYVDVFEPSGAVTSGEPGEEIPVKVAIPNINPYTLSILVDGVDVLKALGVYPIQDLPGGPFSGSIAIGNSIVGVADLVIRTSPLDIPDTNSVTMTLSGLGCGSHVVLVEGDALPDCRGKLSVLRMRYDGGGCDASANTQCENDFDCSGSAGSSSPVRVKAVDRHGRLYYDSGPGASISLRDVFEVNTAKNGHSKMPCDLILQAFDAQGVKLEEVEFSTGCHTGLTVGYVFGSFRVVGIESISNSQDDDHDGDDDDDDDQTAGSDDGNDDDDGDDDHDDCGSSGNDNPNFTASALSNRPGRVPKSESVASGDQTASDHPGPVPVCYVDDLSDRGTALTFRIDIREPTAGSVTPPGPVHVVGEACHGVPIASANINGFPVDVSAQTCTAGDPVNGGGSCVLPIDVRVPITNLRAAINAGGGTAGSFDPGPNRLVAQALDADFNSVFDSFFFAVGPVIASPTFATAGGAASLGPVVAGPAPGDVSPAFVLSLTETGINTFFSALKNTNERCLEDRTERSLRNYRNTKNLDVECDPPTTMVINNTNMRLQDFNLSVDLAQDVMHVRIGFPPIDMSAHFSGYCESDCICAFGGCACAVCVTVDVDATLVQRDMALLFDVTESRIQQSGVPRDQRQPMDINLDFGVNNPDESVMLRGGVDVGCLLGFLLDLVSFFVLVFTLGFVDLNLSNFSFEITQADIEARLDRGRDGDPFDVDFAKFKNEDLPEFGTRQRDSRVDDVQITETGMSIGIGASFEPDPAQLDPAAANIPGTPVDLAPLPQSPIIATDGRPVGMVTLAFSDDLFNQLFNSMVHTGRLRTNFEVTRTLRDFVPDNCNDISDASRRARCVGTQAADPPSGARFCGRVDGFTDACEAAYPYIGGDDQLRRQCCRSGRIRRNANIGGGTTIILQGIIHNPPQLLINDVPGTPDVEVVLRFPQISLHLIADRDGNGVLNSGALETIPDCAFGDLDSEFGAQSTNATECVLWETCPTIDLNLGMQLGVNPRNGRDRIQFNFGGVRRDTPFTVSCGGASDPVELDFFNEQAGRSETFDILDNQLRDRTPPLEHDGLELGGFVTFDKDRIIAIETDNDPNGFQDYIGITGNLIENPPPTSPSCD